MDLTNRNWQDTSRHGEGSSSQHRGVEHHRRDGTRFQLTAIAQVEAEVPKWLNEGWPDTPETRKEILQHTFPHLEEQYRLEQQNLAQTKRTTPSRSETRDYASLHPLKGPEKVYLPERAKTLDTSHIWPERTVPTGNIWTLSPDELQMLRHDGSGSIEEDTASDNPTSGKASAKSYPPQVSHYRHDELQMLSPDELWTPSVNELPDLPGTISGMPTPSSSSRDVTKLALNPDAPAFKPSTDKWAYSGKIGTIQEVKHIRKKDVDNVTRYYTQGVQRILIELKSKVSRRPNNDSPEDQISNNESFIKEWDQCAQNGSEELKNAMYAIIHYVSSRESD